MKKICSGLFLALTIVLAGALPPALAQTPQISLTLNGSTMESDVPPYIDTNSRTIVPIRVIGTGLGHKVDWNGEKKEVRIQGAGTDIFLTVDSRQARVNGRTVEMDTTAVIRDGRTMLPLRFVAENLGARVTFEPASKTVAIRTDQVAVRTVTKVKVQVSTVLNVRSAPRTDQNNILGKAANGEVFSVTGRENGWYRIDYQGKTGWISEEYAVPEATQVTWVDREEAEPEKPADSGVPTKTVTRFQVVISHSSTLNIRTQPSMTASVLGKASHGDQFDYISRSGSWVQIRYGGSGAWVHGDYGKLVEVEQVDWDRVVPEQGRINSEVVNVRSTPEALSDNSNRIAQVVFGDPVKILSSDNQEWYQVELSGGQKGWVVKRAVDLLDAEGNPISDQQLNLNVPARVLVVNTRDSNVRQGPGTTHPVVAISQPGDILPILAEQGQWYQVALPDGRNGFISGSLGQTRSEQTFDGQIEDVKRSQLAAITELSVRDDQVTVKSDRDLLYKVFYINDPARVLIRFYDVTLAGGLAGSHSASGSRLTGVETVQYGENQVHLLMNFSAPAGMEVTSVSGQKQVSFQGTAAPLAGRTVVLDPGHGAYRASGAFDPGAISPGGLKEYESNLDTALKTRDRLLALGARVIMTHGENSQLIRMDLEDRTKLANASGADIFVSIHSDSMPSNPAVNGISAFYHNGNGNITEKQRLAALLLEELCGSTGRNSRGVKTANFYVIKNTNIPSALVEIGFLTNPVEEQLLRTPEFRAKAADGIAAAIARYFQ